MSLRSFIDRNPLLFCIVVLFIGLLYPFYIAYQANIYRIADEPPAEVHAMKILIDQAIDIKHNNPDYDFKKINTLSPGFFGTQSKLTVYKYGSGIVNNVEGGYTDLFIKENKETHSIALHSQGYDKDFCDKVQKLSLLSFSQAIELGDNALNETKSPTSPHFILLKEFYSLLEDPHSDILLNGQSIKQSPKSLTCNENENTLVLSKKY